MYSPIPTVTPQGHLLARLSRNSLCYAALPGIVRNVSGIEVTPTRDLHNSWQTKVLWSVSGWVSSIPSMFYIVDDVLRINCRLVG